MVLIMSLLGLALAGALLIGIYVLFPTLLERTLERVLELGFEPASIGIGLALIALGVFVIRPLVNNRLRGQYWVEVPRPRFALAWAVVYLTSGVVFLYVGFGGR